MKFHIKYFENGAFVTDIGGPLDTLVEAVRQIDRYSTEVHADPLDSFVGCKWERGGRVTCGLIVFDEFGRPISEFNCQK